MKRWCSYLKKNVWYLLNTAKKKREREIRFYSTTLDIAVVTSKHITKTFVILLLIQYIKGEKKAHTLKRLLFSGIDGCKRLSSV